MPRRRKVRLDPLYNFASQRLYHEIIMDAELGNKADIKLLWPEFDMMWRMCGKPPIEVSEEGYECFMFQCSKHSPIRRYIDIPQTEEPRGVLDRTHVNEDDDC